MDRVDGRKRLKSVPFRDVIFYVNKLLKMFGGAKERTAIIIVICLLFVWEPEWVGSTMRGRVEKAANLMVDHNFNGT